MSERYDNSLWEKEFFPHGKERVKASLKLLI